MAIPQFREPVRADRVKLSPARERAVENAARRDQQERNRARYIAMHVEPKEKAVTDAELAERQAQAAYDAATNAKGIARLSAELEAAKRQVPIAKGNRSAAIEGIRPFQDDVAAAELVVRYSAIGIVDESGDDFFSKVEQFEQGLITYLARVEGIAQFAEAQANNGTVPEGERRLWSALKKKLVTKMERFVNITLPDNQTTRRLRARGFYEDVLARPTAEW
jgi:hypothetical protein